VAATAALLQIRCCFFLCKGGAAEEEQQYPCLPAVPQPASCQRACQLSPSLPAVTSSFSLQAKLRKSWGWTLDLPAVLLIGGGEGMGPVEATTRALAVTLKGETRFPGTWESQELDEALGALDSLAEMERLERTKEERASLGGSVLQRAESREG